MKTTTNKRSVGGYQYEEEVHDDGFILSFSVTDAMKDKGVTPSALAYAVYSAFALQGREPERLRREEAERESGGIDIYVLRKLKNEVDHVLTRYSAKTIAAQKAEREAARAFSKDDVVRFSNTVKDLNGKTGTVVAVRGKTIIVLCDGKSWKATPDLITKVEEPR